MNTFLIALIIIVAILLILIIMVQNPKGGGLSSTFGGGGVTMGGVQSTNTFLDKSTWTLAAVMVGLIILTNFTLRPDTGEAKSGLKETLENRLEVPESNDSPAETPAPAKDTQTDNSKKPE